MKSEVNSSSFCLAVTMTLHIPLFQELPRACVYTRMNISSRRTHYLSSVMFFWLLCSAVLLKAQTTTMPSTQRYGSGLINIPIASVLPHMMITGTYSGFFMDLNRTIEIDVSGNETGFGPPIKHFSSDASVTLGLFDRVEIGTTLQSFNERDLGGNMWGVFGRAQLLRPQSQGLGLAFGGRYVTAPNFEDDVTYQPTRLGIPDKRFRKSYVGIEDVNTQLSLYGVATVHIQGFDQSALPEHDLTFTGGYGSGMFKDGDELEFYRSIDSEGWFFGSAVHIGVGNSSVLTFMSEYDGFDVNLGAQFDVAGIRIGAHYLAVNYSEPSGGHHSEYWKPKLAVLGSVALRVRDKPGLNRPTLMERLTPDTVVLPAPPPDTVRIEVATLPPAEGSLVNLCLSTGETVQLRLTPEGDTLIGPDRIPLNTLQPVLDFAGTYAGTTQWFVRGDPISFEDRIYEKMVGEGPVDCEQIMRVGQHLGVGLFTPRNADRPFETFYVAVRPGVWQTYFYRQEKLMSN